MIWSRVWHLTEINMFSWRSTGIKRRKKTNKSLHELPVTIQSAKALEPGSWFRIGESRFRLQSNPVNVSQIPHCILAKSRISYPGEYRVPDLPSTATSTQIPNHNTIKKRCNIKQTTRYKQAKTEEVEINYKMFANRVFTNPGRKKPAKCSQDL